MCLSSPQSELRASAEFQYALSSLSSCQHDLMTVPDFCGIWGVINGCGHVFYEIFTQLITYNAAEKKWNVMWQSPFFSDFEDPVRDKSFSVTIISTGTNTAELCFYFGLLMQMANYVLQFY
ncbi:unnamed protein product [Ilex paraguariensis]|uniref:Uncharacterized protein n=1 Tax=Ilex paraguariensis TaxID=185542 RepID=A0ABC8TPI3_9AQUA